MSRWAEFGFAPSGLTFPVDRRTAINGIVLACNERRPTAYAINLIPRLARIDGNAEVAKMHEVDTQLVQMLDTWSYIKTTWNRDLAGIYDNAFLVNETWVEGEIGEELIWWYDVRYPEDAERWLYQRYRIFNMLYLSHISTAYVISEYSQKLLHSMGGGNTIEEVYAAAVADLYFFATGDGGGSTQMNAFSQCYMYRDDDSHYWCSYLSNYIDKIKVKPGELDEGLNGVDYCIFYAVAPLDAYARRIFYSEKYDSGTNIINLGEYQDNRELTYYPQTIGDDSVPPYVQPELEEKTVNGWCIDNDQGNVDKVLLRDYSISGGFEFLDLPESES